MFGHYLIIRRPVIWLKAAILVLLLVLASGLTNLRADSGSCGGTTTTLPFTDVPSSNIFFCAIAEAFFSGLTNGTSSTTYSPSANVPREQMAAFVTRTMDQSLKRGSRRAALDQFWTSSPRINSDAMIGAGPRLAKSDGADLWVACHDSDSVVRVRASDGKVLETWTGADNAYGVISAMGVVLVTGNVSPGKLYGLNPTVPAGSVVAICTTLGNFPSAVGFDGVKVWTANNGSVSIVTPSSIIPWSATTVSSGFIHPKGIVFDGSNIWVSDTNAGTLLKLDSSAGILQTVSVGSGPEHPCFDGTNIWVPNEGSSTVTVVRASTGAVLATLTGNGLSGPFQAAFDGQRILVTNGAGDSVSLWKAADLTPIGSFPMPGSSVPLGACSDGINFWITLRDYFLGLARF